MTCETADALTITLNQFYELVIEELVPRAPEYAADGAGVLDSSELDEAQLDAA